MKNYEEDEKTLNLVPLLKRKKIKIVRKIVNLVTLSGKEIKKEEKFVNR